MGNPFSTEEEPQPTPTHNRRTSDEIRGDYLYEISELALQKIDDEEIATEIDLTKYGDIGNSSSKLLLSFFKMIFTAICTTILIFCLCFASIDWIFRLSLTFSDDFDSYDDYFDEDFLVDIGLSSSVIATCLGALFGHEFVLIHLLDYMDEKYQKLDNNCFCCKKCKCFKKNGDYHHERGVGFCYLFCCCCIFSKCRSECCQCLYETESPEFSICDKLGICGCICKYCCMGICENFICDLFNPQVTISFFIFWFIMFAGVAFGLEYVSNCIEIYQYVAVILLVVLFFLLPQISVSIRDYRSQYRLKKIQDKKGELVAELHQNNLSVTQQAGMGVGIGGNNGHNQAIKKLDLSTCGKISTALQIALGIVGFLIGGLRMRIGFDETIDSCIISNNTLSPTLVPTAVPSAVNLNVNATWNYTRSWESAINMTWNDTYYDDFNGTGAGATGTNTNPVITTTTSVDDTDDSLSQLEEAFGGYRTALFGILAMVSCVEVIYEAQNDFWHEMCTVSILSFLLLAAWMAAYFASSLIATLAAAIPLAYVILDKCFNFSDCKKCERYDNDHNGNNNNNNNNDDDDDDNSNVNGGATTQLALRQQVGQNSVQPNE